MRPTLLIKNPSQYRVFTKNWRGGDGAFMGARESVRALPGLIVLLIGFCVELRTLNQPVSPEASNPSSNLTYYSPS